MKKDNDRFFDAKGELQDQFDKRAGTFDASANWITDKALINAHVDLCGAPEGEALELCCGTGQVGRALKTRGWSVRGLDVCNSMVEKAKEYFPVESGRAEELPFDNNSFSVVVCRQSFQFLDAVKALSEIKRVLAPGGKFIMSLTVPFCEEDREWLLKIHKTKQPLLLKFYEEKDLARAMEEAGFALEAEKALTVRESINKWMDFAPELSQEVKNRVIDLVKSSPEEYRKHHKVEVVNGEVFEDWKWVVFKAHVKE